MRSRPSTKTRRGLDRQRGDRARQRPQRRAQDIVAIDAPRRRHGDRDLRAGADAFVEHLAPLRREPLRIVKAAGNIVGIENDGSGDDRSGERTAPGFVASGDRPHAAFERRAARGGTSGGEPPRRAADAAPASRLSDSCAHDDHAAARSATRAAGTKRITRINVARVERSETRERSTGRSRISLSLSSGRPLRAGPVGSIRATIKTNRVAPRPASAAGNARWWYRPWSC